MPHLAARLRASALVSWFLLLTLTASLVPFSSSPFQPQDVQAQPTDTSIYACANIYTGVLRHVTAPSQCSPSSGYLLDLNSDSPITVCASIYSGRLRYAGSQSCTAHEITLTLPGEEATSLCAGDYTGQLRYVLTEDCPAGEGQIIVPQANDPPVAQDDAFSSDEDTQLTGNVLNNNGSGVDADPDGDPLTVNSTPVSGPTHGTLVLNSDGSFTYDPDPDFNGTDTFVYTVSDDRGASDTATVTITVNPINDAPIADGQSVTTDEDASVVITLTGMDVDGDALAFAIDTDPTNGTLGSITQVTPATAEATYTPNTDYNGSDSFTFNVNDGTVDSAAAVVTITVEPVNDAPIADDQSVTTDEDAPVTITLTGSDIDGDALTFAIDTGPTNGSLEPVAPVDATSAQVTYTPDDSYSGSDSFTFTVNDGTTTSPAATVSITINDVNDPPVVDDATFSVEENSANDTDVGTVNATDPEAGQTLTFSITSGNTGNTFAIDPNSGQITVADNAALDFETNPTFSLTVQATDDGAPPMSGDATITINLTDVNDAPLAVQDDYDAYTNTELTAGGLTVTGLAAVVSAASVLDNDGDPDTNPAFGQLTIDADSGASTQGGTFTINTNGQFSYIPPAGFTGVDSFSYTLRDNGPNGGLTAAGTVQITVAGEAIWYVDTSEGSNGTGVSTDPFNVINASTVNGGGDVDSPNEIIYVASGTGNSGALNLEAGQQLIGEGVDLVVTVQSSPTTIAPAGTRPTMGTLTLAADNTVRGLNVNATTGIAGVDVDALTLNSVGITSTNGSALNIAGGTAAMSVSIDSLVATSGASPGVRAVNNAMGSLTITGSTNTISSTTGVALRVANTTIGMDGLTFQSISADGAASGIILNNTGTTDGLTVTGNGGVCTLASQNTCDGGQIRNTTGTGISLTSTRDVSLTGMLIKDSADHGISGANVTNFTFSTGVIDGAGDASGESALFFALLGQPTPNLDGAGLIEDAYIHGFEEDGLAVANESGTLTMTVDNVEFANSARENGILFETYDTATLTTLVQNSYFSGLASDGIAALASGGTMHFTAQDNEFAGHSTGNPSDNAVVVGSAGSAVVRFNIHSNMMMSSHNSAILFNFNDNSTIDGTVTDNLIQGSANGNGIDGGLVADDNSNTRIRIDNNHISGVRIGGIHLNANNTATLHATVTNNTLDAAAGNGSVFTENLAVQSHSDGNVVVKIENNEVGLSGFSDDFGQPEAIAASKFAGAGAFQLERGASASDDAETVLDENNPLAAPGGQTMLGVEVHGAVGVVANGTVAQPALPNLP